MININLTLTNPWSDRFEPLYGKGGKLFKHKAWEVEVYRSDTVIEFEGRLSFRTDHAGITIGLGLFSWTARFQIYDTRHWDSNTRKWTVYSEENI
jgi:hypothetical protein